jgi:TRAP transporter TAXI family solute receptor
MLGCNGREGSITSQMASKLPRWQRVTLVAGLLVMAAALGLFAYSYFTRPLTLTVAVGSRDEEVVRRMSATASGLATTGSHIRLKVIDTGSALEAAKQMVTGKVDLAVVRDDIPDLSDVRTVLLMTHGVAMIIVPSGSSIESVPDLKGKTVGVVGAEINHRIVDALIREYGLTGGKVQFKDIALAQARELIQARQVQALLVVLPITERNLALVRGLLPSGGKLKPKLIPIDAAGAIEVLDKSYESYELPKGTLQGSPPVPDDDMTTLRVPIYLVANKTLADDKVTELTRAIMETRRDLLNAFPILSQISAPDTDKDAFLPVHPGAAAYFAGNEPTFFDKYGDAIFYGSIVFGSLTSLMAAAWRFMGLGRTTTAGHRPLEALYTLADRIRDEATPSDLLRIEEDIDAILKSELAKHAHGDASAADAGALNLATRRLEHLINHRRSVLASTAEEGSSKKPGPVRVK